MKTKASQSGKKKPSAQSKDWIFWTPRVLSIVFILFLALFSLDVFDMQLGFWGTIVGLVMHNIPAFILLAVLFFSWKREIIGGIAFIAAGLLYILLLLFSGRFEWYMLSYSFIIAGPAFAIGALFLVGWKRRQKA